MSDALYTAFFSLSAQPFSITPDPRFMYSSVLHQEGLAHLLYGIQGNGGFVALTGEVGTGKTLLCHCLVQQLPEKVDLALILNPRMDALELLASICDELGIFYLPEAISLKYLIDILNKYLLLSHAAGRQTVLMIDEAQNLSLEVLEQIRLLTNLETPTEKLLQIILVGQPEFQKMLERQDLRQLNQRITARFHLQALDAIDTRNYILHRMRVCNGRADIFTPDAITTVYKYSGGIPRIINMLCDRALLGAYTLDTHKVTTKLIRQSAQELQLNYPKFHKPLAILLVILVGLILWQTKFAGFKFAAEKLDTKLNSVHAPSSSPATPIKPAKIAPPIAEPISAENNVPVTKTGESQFAAMMDSTNSFEQMLNQKGLTLTAAIRNGVQLLNSSVPFSRISSCNQLEDYGVHCLADRASWNRVVTLKRPVILELDVSATRKIFVLLKSFKNGQAILQTQTDSVVDLGSILSIWNGNYLILWESPFPGVKEITPHETSNAVIWLRKLLDSPATAGAENYFDDSLRDKVMQFQKAHNLIADGIAGGRTIIQLQDEVQSSINKHLSAN